MSRFLIFFPLLLSLGIATVRADDIQMPATTITVDETSSLSAVGGKTWFGGLTSSTDLGFRGLRSVGLRAGKLLDGVTLDLDVHYYMGPFSAWWVHRSGDIHPVSLPTPEAEVARNRQGMNGSMLTLGPGVGGVFRLFGSKRVLETLRFGLNYARYSENQSGLSFIGAQGSFAGGIAYKLDPFLLGLNASWNLAYLQRTVDVPHRDTIVKNTFLPMQWWGLQVSVMAFAF